MDVTTGKHTRWPLVRLGEVCVVIAGQSPEGQYYNTDGIGMPFYQGKKDFGEKYVNPSNIWTTQITKIAEAGDILMSVRAPVGPINYATEKICIGRGLASIRPQDLVFRDFLFYYLTFIQPQISGREGAVFASISKVEITSILIPLPPLAEQQRIVARLDAAFAAIAEASAAAEANLRNARALFDSYLGRQSSQKVKLGQFIDIKTGKLDANAAQENGKYVFFTCAKETYKIDAYAFDCEAILLAGNNAVGDFNVKHFSGKFNAYQRTYVITINTEDKLSYRWLYYQLLKKLKELKVESVGVGTKFLKIDMIRDLEIDLPDLQQQYLTTTAIDFLNAEVTKYSEIVKHKLVMMAQLKQSLLAEVFGVGE